MRLINVETLKFEQFYGDDIPRYAILSHTWGADEEEISFLDVQGGNIKKPGNGQIKLRGCCKQAREDGLRYAWVDTCNIDKTDSVELGEAINSMFRWYKTAAVCYVYLRDVPDEDDPRKEASAFRQSRWFRRGWTLQELLAPRNLRFYNSEWRCIGTKGDLCAIVGAITGVPRQFLLGITELHTASVAQRMSWAAKRDTKRKEDLAYCLLGLFGVTMPMVYGEGGDHAFLRLQEQIMRTTRDDSILAWGPCLKEQPTSDMSLDLPGRILAAAPSAFAESGHIVCREDLVTSQSLIDMSGGSLRICLSLLPTSEGGTVGLLNCGPENDMEHVFGIPLVPTTKGSTEEYTRPSGRPSILQPVTSSRSPPRLISINNNNEMQSKPVAENTKYWHYGDGFAEVNLHLIDVMPPSRWDKERALIVSKVEPGEVTHRTLARFRHDTMRECQDILLVLELEEESMKPCCTVLTCERITSLEEIVGKLDYLMQKVSGFTCASIGLLKLHVALESVPRQPIFVVRPETVSHIRQATINATDELQKEVVMRELVAILKEKGLNDAEEEDLRLKVAGKQNHIRELEKEREKTENEIKRLQGVLSELEEADHTGALELERLWMLQTEVEERQSRASKQWVQAQNRWCELHHTVGRGEPAGLEQIGRKTPLLWAVEGGHVDMVQLLLDEGNDPEVGDQDGRTPIMCAARGGEDAIVELLLQKGADPESKDSRGRTSLALAARYGHEAVVQLLLLNRVEMDVEDGNDLTPILWAKAGRHWTIEKLLVENSAKYVLNGSGTPIWRPQSTTKQDTDHDSGKTTPMLATHGTGKLSMSPAAKKPSAEVARLVSEPANRLMCQECGEPLKGRFVRALGSTFHLNCFRCRDCTYRLASRFYRFQGSDDQGQLLLCEFHYFSRLGRINAYK